MGGAAVLLQRLSESGAPALRLTPGQSRALEGFLRKLGSNEYPCSPRPCLCGAAADVPIARRDRFGIPLDTFLCRSCGLMRSDPFLTPQALARFYREDYRAIYSPGGAAEIFADEERAGESIRRWLSGRPARASGTVFEIGCGAGGVLQAFRARGWRTAGCDFDPEYLAYGRARGLTLEEGGAEALRRHGAAGLIVLRHVLEHYPEPVAELGRLGALLEPGGLVYVELPGIFSIRATYGDVGLYLQNAHVWHFCLATLDYLMSLAGHAREAGDELIRALYRRAPQGAPIAPDPGCGARVLAELRRVERLRLVPRRQIVTSAVARIARRLVGDARYDALRDAVRGTDDGRPAGRLDG